MKRWRLRIPGLESWVAAPYSGAGELGWRARQLLWITALESWAAAPDFGAEELGGRAGAAAP